METSIRYGGAVLLWRTAQFYERQKLIEGFASLGKPKLTPRGSTRDSNLRYALEEKFAKAGVLVRPNQYGFAIIKEGRSDTPSKPNSYSELSAFWLEEKPAAQQGQPSSWELQMAPFDREIASDVAQTFNRYFGLITGKAVTESLVNLATAECGGTTLREQGGVYWIEEQHIPLWQRVREIVTGAATKGRADVYLIKHRLDTDTIRAVADALQDEITRDVFEMGAELDGDGDEQLGARAIAARQQQTNQLLVKVERYEQLLQKPMGSLRQAVESLNQKAALSSVRLAAAKQREAAKV